MSEKFLFLLHKEEIKTLINNFPSKLINLKNDLRNIAESEYIIDLIFDDYGSMSVNYYNNENKQILFINNFVQNTRFKDNTFTLLSIDANQKMIKNYKNIIQPNIKDYSAILINNNTDERIKQDLFPELEKQFVIYPPVSSKCHIYKNKDKILPQGILTDIKNQIIEKNEINAQPTQPIQPTQPTNGGKRRKTNKKSKKSRKYKKSKKSRKYKKSRK